MKNASLFTCIQASKLFFLLAIFGWIFQAFGQNTYFGPNHPTPKSDTQVRIEISVQDEVGKKNLKIVSVTFDGKSIPLKPADIYGNRGTASFLLPPGSYSLKWKVNRSNLAWPREVSHEEIVHIDPRDSWVQVSILGDGVSIL